MVLLYLRPDARVLSELRVQLPQSRAEARKFFIVNRALIVSTLQNGIEQNTNDLRVLGVDVGYDPSDSRRDLTLRIEYAAVEESKTEVQGVTFV